MIGGRTTRSLSVRSEIVKKADKRGVVAKCRFFFYIVPA